jgi:nicotinamidase-related amidase
MAAVGARSVPLTLNLRERTEATKGSGKTIESTRIAEFEPAETAIVICDLWDKHWCASATKRCGEIARRMAPVIEQARSRGVTIIHCPSDTMNFYQDTPQRKRMQAAPDAPDAPKSLDGWCRLMADKEGKLPVDDSDGGCDDEPQCKNYHAWSRESPAIRIAEEDGVTDKGREVYNLFKQRGIKNILYMGVHANMCVLGRSFAIRQMSQLGFHCVLIRDLTDAMYNPRMDPKVSHAEGTELIIEHIERNWCPSALSADLMK